MATQIVDLDEADEISRCIIYNRAFDKEVHVDAALWPFETGAATDGSVHESAVLRRFAPLPEDVHKIGCKIAAIQNERKNNPPPGEKRRYYCGFRTAKFGTLPKVGSGYSILFRHLPEHGEHAHVDVALLFSETVTNRNARATRRTEAIMALAECFDLPTAHRCLCDLEDNQHPLERFGADCLSRGLDSGGNLSLPISSNATI